MLLVCLVVLDFDGVYSGVECLFKTFTTDFFARHQRKRGCSFNLNLQELVDELWALYERYLPVLELAVPPLYPLGRRGRVPPTLGVVTEILRGKAFL